MILPLTILKKPVVLPLSDIISADTYNHSNYSGEQPLPINPLKSIAETEDVGANLYDNDKAIFI